MFKLWSTCDEWETHSIDKGLLHCAKDIMSSFTSNRIKMSALHKNSFARNEFFLAKLFIVWVFYWFLLFMCLYEHITIYLLVLFHFPSLSLSLLARFNTACDMWREKKHNEWIDPISIFVVFAGDCSLQLDVIRFTCMRINLPKLTHMHANCFPQANYQLSQIRKNPTFSLLIYIQQARGREGTKT